MGQADRTDASVLSRVLSWLQRHAQESVGALGRMSRRPISTLLTALVIGITLALPLSLWVALKNLDMAEYAWERSFALSAFLNSETSDEAGEKLAQELAGRDGVLGHRFVSRAQALAEFRELSGFAEALDLLDENPLPAVIVLDIAPELSEDRIQALATEIGGLPQIDDIQMDSAWLQRLQALTGLGHRSVTVLAVLLWIAVIITVGNTIRLDVQSRRDEIVVMKLVGAPDAFVRRPFVYTGIWYGLIGGLLAWFCLQLALDFIAPAVQQLAGLYESDFELRGPGFSESLMLILTGGALGLFGALLAVAVHLAAIEPE